MMKIFTRRFWLIALTELMARRGVGGSKFYGIPGGVEDIILVEILE